MKKLNLLLFCVAGVVLISIIIYFVIQYYQRPDYVLEVDAMREEQSLFKITRIILTNAGKEQITNTTVFYGVKNETIQTINPGEKISLSPPEGSNLNVVRIIADNGINITAGYRTPIKMPGMMGS